MTNKLFVTKLSYKTTDDTLAAHFEPYGKLIWCQVVKDRETGASKRFAFVQFEKDEDADKALEELKDTTVDGCRIAIEWSHQGTGAAARANNKKDEDGGRRSRSGTPVSRSPSEERKKKEVLADAGDSSCVEHTKLREGEEVRLFVGGLPIGVHEDDLMELFKDCDPVDAFVCRDKEPPCGFITLKNDKETVDRAFEKNNIYYKNSKWRLAVKEAKPPRQRNESPPRRRGRSSSYDRGGRGRSRSRGRRSRSRSGGRGRQEVRLFVGGLPEGVKEDDLLEFFKKCDPTDVFVPRDRQRTAPFYGFVAVKDDGDNVKRALAYDGEKFNSETEHRLTIAYSKPRRQDLPPRRRSPSPRRYRSRSRSPRRYRRSYSRGRSRSRSRDRYRDDRRRDYYRSRSRSRSRGRY